MIKGLIFDIHGTLIQPGSNKPFPKVAELLQFLSGKYGLAYATSWNPERVSMLLENFDLLKYFSVKVYDAEVENGKPAADVYLEAASRLGLKENECLVIEDGEDCIENAKIAGFITVAHKAPHNDYAKFAMADFAVNDLLEIKDILKNLK